MKIAILGFTNIRYMPYLNFYLDCLDLSEHEVHVLCWERVEGVDKPLPKGVTAHAIHFPMLDVDRPIKKAKGIQKYARFARRTLKEIDPDLLIVTYTTTALTVLPLLCGKYKKRYIFDYRDMTYERHGFYKKAAARIVKNAALSFTSSDGFRHVLPKVRTLLTSHNIPNDARDIAERYVGRKPQRDGVIRIAFWGLFRHAAVNEAIIDALGGDKRFELHYYGRAQGTMLDLVTVASARYSNVYFHGEYTAEDRYKFAEEMDLIHNVYAVKGTMAPAMSNKYYAGLLFHMPQLCAKGSYMGDRCEQLGIGLAVDPFSETFADDVYDWYQTYDETAADDGYRKELDRVMNQVDDGIAAIHRVVEGEDVGWPPRFFPFWWYPSARVRRWGRRFSPFSRKRVRIMRSSSKTAVRTTIPSLTFPNTRRSASILKKTAAFTTA